MDDDGKPKNDACSYDVKLPSPEKYPKDAKVIFKLLEAKRVKVYIKYGTDEDKLKSIKGRRRLTTEFEDQPLKEGEE